MAHTSEITFKDLQMDERYKRLERTLKMVVLKNADNRSVGTWPSISSINGDNLDTSCAGMSIQSSRIGSEVVASSSNLRNIMGHKKSSGNFRNNMVTSSENQFPINKDEDSAMMPPPKMPGPSTYFKRCSTDNKHTPLLNMSRKLDRHDNGFTQSTPVIGVSSVSQCSGSSDRKTTLEQNDYPSRHSYEESRGNGQPNKPQERIFSRWRVLLNDKTQLIIKGTLECGKVARSKPVIRRLTATSVQSIFKHTYHLRGNLVDERNELPEYVSGKFCNGFPDDWENVCQVWRNFVSAGSRLSFRWPTPITDSDDDIKSEITEMSYLPRFEKRNKSRSPRKHMNSSKPLSPLSPTKAQNSEHSERNSCGCSQIKTPKISPDYSIESSVCQAGTRPNHSICEPKVTTPVDRNKSLNETSVASLDNSQRVIGNSLKDIIQEDKLNIIIDNLTSKNCPLEYIHKIVEMFDCMKYVVKYQSEDNNSETPNSSKIVKESCAPSIETAPTVETSDLVKPPQHTGNHSVSAGNGDTNTSNKLQRGRCNGNARRKLTKEDYDSAESENDSYDLQRRTFVDPRSHERSRKLHSYKDYKAAKNTAREKQRYRNSERILNESRETQSQFKENRRRNEQDSSFSEEDFSMNKSLSAKDSKSRAFTNSRTRRIRGNEFIGNTDPRDSSISLTEDDVDDCYKKEPRMQVTRKEYYDSSVSITEDERGDVRVDRKFVHSANYYSQTNSRAIDQGTANRTKTDDSRNGQKVTPQTFNELNRYTVDTNVVSDTAQRSSGKTPLNERPIITSLNRQDNRNRAADFVSEQEEDSAYVSSEVRRQRTPARILAETDSTKSYANERLKEIVCNAEPPTPLNTNQQPKKPVVVSCKIVNMDTQQLNMKNTENDINAKNNENDTNTKNNENDMNFDNKPRKSVSRSGFSQSISEIKNTPVNQKITAYLVPERVKTAESSNPKNKASGNVINQHDKTDSREAKSGKEIVPDGAEKRSVAKFGSEENPKQLSGWVPAVICDKDDSTKCHLVFEGKLLNEAGHVVNRKFTTDFVKRRRSAKLIETVDQVFYELVGDLYDTKRMVPKELVKLCHTGCPSKINVFCEKWISLSSVNNETPKKIGMHNTSVDCLSVPTSSRGRRILPPLNYWTGERITTKDNRAIYSPGNSKETSFTSSMEKTNEEAIDERNSPRARRNRASNQAVKKKNTEKISTAANESFPPPQQESPKRRVGKRRLTKKKHDSSSESDENGTEKKTAPKKRNMKRNNSATKADTSPKRQLRNSSKNAGSPQNWEQSASSHRSSFENAGETETPWKLRKRQKLNQDEGPIVAAGTSRQLMTRGSSGITCTFYKNVPLRDGDLSEDQLSTM